MSRQYDIVVFGATGYTGKYTAEYITTSLSVDLKWALAGRSESKLKAVADELKALNPDRLQPGIEVCNLNDADLSALAKKTKVIIATVGPYGEHGEHAFKACAENGTHYLDATGEIPYVARMLKKYEATAQESGSIMIPQIGVESAPPDLITWSLVNMIKERFSAPTGEVVVSVHEVNSAPSGGTLSTVLSFFESFSLAEIKESMGPYAISPKPGPNTPDTTSWTTKLFGIRSVPDLGLLTTTFPATTDTPIVQRSWGFLDYGPNFTFHEYMKARNAFTGVVLHFGLILGGLLIVIPFFRTLARKFVYQPGDGPTREQSKNDHFEYRGIAYPDVKAPNPPRAFCKASFRGSMYLFTAVSLAEGAISILRDDHKLSGGVYTPATLGQKFIDRLESAGFKFEKKFYD